MTKREQNKINKTKTALEYKALRLAKYSLEEIGIKYSLTRERVRQVLQGEFGTTFNEEAKLVKRTIYKFTCKHCGEAKEITSIRNRVFCDSNCRSNYFESNKEERLARKRERINNYSREYYKIYNKTPKRRQKIREYYKEYMQRPEVKNRSDSEF